MTAMAVAGKGVLGRPLAVASFSRPRWHSRSFLGLLAAVLHVAVGVGGQDLQAQIMIMEGGCGSELRTLYA